MYFKLAFPLLGFLSFINKSMRNDNVIYNGNNEKSPSHPFLVEWKKNYNQPSQEHHATMKGKRQVSMYCLGSLYDIWLGESKMYKKYITVFIFL